MSYFPCDIPFMSDEELKENGIHIPKEKMADKYIRKEDVEDVIAKRSGFETAKRAKKWAMMHPIDLDPWFGATATAIIAVESLEPADVAPVVHAYWIPQKENHEFKEVWMKCSACGYPVSRWTGNTKFCPNCGAKMDGNGED